MSDQEEIAFREMFPLVIGALVALTVLLVIIAMTLDSRDDVYVPSGQTRTEVLLDRLSPIGQVQFGGPEEVAMAEEEDAPADPRSGSTVYAAICAACHDSGAAGAPRMDDAGAWEDRLAERGIDGLHQSVINGRGAMPARGGGGDGYSDDELRSSVEYILEEVGVSW
jgi:cytochrome c5